MWFITLDCIPDVCLVIAALPLKHHTSNTRCTKSQQLNFCHHWGEPHDGCSSDINSDCRASSFEGLYIWCTKWDTASLGRAHQRKYWNALIVGCGHDDDGCSCNHLEVSPIVISSCSCLCPIHWSHLLSSRMKIWLEQHRQTMLQLHLSDQYFYCLIRCDLY